MANILIGWDNKADAATLTAGSEVATLPATNVQHPHLAKKWHTGAGVETSHLILDMGSSLACALGALLGTNLTASATVRWRASDADATVTSSLLLDTGTVNAGVKAGYGASYKGWASVTARYWRVDIVDATLPDNLQIGRVFLGPRWAPAVNMELDWSVNAMDESELSESWGLQVFADERPQRRVLKFTLGFMTEAEMYGNAFAMARAQGRVRDILAIPDLDGTYLSEQAVFGLLEASEPLVNDRLALFRQRFSVKERL